jgi:hypothetical protein
LKKDDDGRGVPESNGVNDETGKTTRYEPPSAAERTPNPRDYPVRVWRVWVASVATWTRKKKQKNNNIKKMRIMKK